MMDVGGRVRGYAYVREFFVRERARWMGEVGEGSESAIRVKRIASRYGKAAGT